MTDMTHEEIEATIIVIEEALKNLGKPWSDQDYEFRIALRGMHKKLLKEMGL